MDNRRIADVLERVAELLAVQDASVYRVRAYRLAAKSVRELEQPAADIVAHEGAPGLDRLPHVGPNIARAIVELCSSGRLRMLDRLERELGPEQLFASIPGVGACLAHRIHTALQIETLEDLEVAAHDGRLAAVRGMGPRRVRALRELLASLLRSQRFEEEHARARGAIARPSVEDLLAIDARYRRQSADGALPTIAPRRFNPKREAWLPVLHADTGPFHVTALFSNTALAHKLGTTRDWVVIFYDGPSDGQCTVVTERHPGPLKGMRVVRGREQECAEFHAAHLGDGAVA